jgi:hypothetical protein
MTRWEYRSILVKPNEPLAHALTPLGKEGWEAVGMVRDPKYGELLVLFKREMEDEIELQRA